MLHSDLYSQGLFRFVRNVRWTASFCCDNCLNVFCILLTIEQTYFYSYSCRWCSHWNMPITMRWKDWFSFRQRSLLALLSWYALGQVSSPVMKVYLSVKSNCKDSKRTWKFGMKDAGTILIKEIVHRAVKQRKNTIKRGWKCMLRCAFIQVRDLLWEEN